MNDEVDIVEDRETDRLAVMLGQAVCNSEEYRYYQEKLSELKKNPELYAKVNELRRSHFMLQNGSDNKMTYEEYANISALSKQLRENPLANAFLDSEIGIGRLVQHIYRKVMVSIDFDSDFLN